jgi:ketosteroid isomerase-like protein
MIKSVVGLVIGCLVIGIVATSGAAGGAKPAVGPTPENALAAEQSVAQALLANDAAAVGRLLNDDWVVISSHGGMAERPDFLEAIKSGNFTRSKMDLSEPRVRIYGNVAVVTSKLACAGTFVGKGFAADLRQTDVLVWQDGGWKSVLTHESDLRK